LKETLLKEKEEKEKLNKFLENEKEMFKRKTTYLRESSNKLNNINSESNLISTSTDYNISNNLDKEKSSINTSPQLTKSSVIYKPVSEKYIKSSKNYNNCEDEEEKSRINEIKKPAFNVEQLGNFNETKENELIQDTCKL
jgi:hypothetical protein